MGTGISPLAPLQFPVLPEVAGVRLAASGCGLRYKQRPDVMLVTLPPGSTVGGVFTRSKMVSAPVEWCQHTLPSGLARAILVNAGNANAFTGKAGMKAVEAEVAALSKTLSIEENAVFIASTGVIGEPLDVARIIQAIPELAQSSGSSPTHWEGAARAIMTTDTFPKAATRVAQLGSAKVTLNGIAKGSGMIAPDMATMLAFLFTDACLPAPVLQALLARSCDHSFHCITVDGDTSTSDTVLFCATGQGNNHPPINRPDDPILADFEEKLQDLTRDLALQIVRDGEGASKILTLDITGAASPEAARHIGLSVANSPLVKTALAGGDPNWGRLVMAVGKAGEKADRDRLKITIGGIMVACDGQQNPQYNEAMVASHMAGSEISIAIDVGVGQGNARVWTCDFTQGYIHINADYRS